MAARARHVIQTIIPACFATAFFTMAACSAGYYTANMNGEKKVYRIDEHDAKTLVYETDQYGKITIHDANDPMAKRQAAEQESSEQLSRMPKRQPSDPIYVNLAQPVLDAQMEKAERSKGAVADQIRSEFQTDPIIKLIEEDRDRSGLLKPRVPASADIEVLPKVSLKEAYGIDRKTGKPSKMLAVVFEATITTQVPPATYNVSESGHVLRNLEISKRFANQVKQVILEKIGPSIPAH